MVLRNLKARMGGLKKSGILSALLGAAIMLPGSAMAQEGLPDPVAEWDELWMKTLIEITLIGVVFSIVAVYWLIKYRKKSNDQVGSAPKLSRAQMWAWALVPAALFMAADFFLAAKGWDVWNTFRRVPEEAMEIKVYGYQWFWEFDYGNDVLTEELVVPQGTPVVLRMVSEDVLHSFYMPEYRVKEDVMPGRVTYIWFLPKEETETFVTCTEYCGSEHTNMFTPVIVKSPEEYEAWMAEKIEEAALDAASDNKFAKRDQLAPTAVTIADVNG